MEEDSRRTILLRVADGTLLPDEAARLLSDLDGPADEAGAPPPPPDARPERVRIAGDFGVTRVVADASIAEAVVEGPHRVRRDGTTLVIQSDPMFDDGRGFRFHDWSRIRQRAVSVRVNPDLPLEIELAAGTLSVTGARAGVKAHVSAGNAAIDGIRGPLDLFVAAGNLRVSAVVTGDRNRVQCEAGNARVNLEPGSSVRVNARASLGRVRMPDGTGTTGIMGDGRDYVVGAGEGRLDVETSFGNVVISCG
jgi:hypothetical protein